MEKLKNREREPVRERHRKKIKRQRGTGQSWQKNNKFSGAIQVGGQAERETEEGRQADIWRRVAEMGQDAEERTCNSLQLLVLAGDLHHPDASLSASAPSSSAVPPARPSPTQQHTAEASTLLICKASLIHGGSRM